MLLLSAAQIVPAVHVVLSRSGKLPTDQFVDLFVRLRHPHHFDPTAWHWGVWLAFLAPIPFALLARRSLPADHAALRRASTLFLLFAAMVAFALVTAGFWFAGETFVQLNLYRFSIYPKLLACVGLAWMVWETAPARRPYVVAALLLLATGAAALAAASGLLAPPTLRHPLGLRVKGLEGDDPGYRELAAWARDHTPKDAVFLVPPDEESFRVHARRAIVVNFKGVPQLSGELPAWRDRLCDTLDLDTDGLLALPRPMGRTLEAIRARYESLTSSHHLSVAQKYGARYVVLAHQLDSSDGWRLVHTDSTGRYFLYDLVPGPQQ
jgi:hypothetical protein